MKLATAAAAIFALGLASTAQAQPPNQNQQHNNAHPAPGHAQGQPGAPRGGPGQVHGQPAAGRPGGAPLAGRGAPTGAPRGGVTLGAAAGRGAMTARAVPRQMTAARRFNAPAAHYPTGWYARQWSYGQYLPAGWFAPAFYLAWANFGLSAPPPGCAWVREGSDAVLVDIATGEVLSVDYNVFW